MGITHRLADPADEGIRRRDQPLADQAAVIATLLPIVPDLRLWNSLIYTSGGLSLNAIALFGLICWASKWGPPEAVPDHWEVPL